MRALGLVTTVLFCLGERQLPPLDWQSGAGLCKGKVLGVVLGSAKDVGLSSFLVFHPVSLEAEWGPEHKTLGSLGQRSPSAAGLHCAAWQSFSPSVMPQSSQAAEEFGVTQGDLGAPKPV